MIFACFMVSSMVGSAIAGKLLGNNSGCAGGAGGQQRWPCESVCVCGWGGDACKQSGKAE